MSNGVTVFSPGGEMSKINSQNFPEVLSFSGSVGAACDMTGSLLCSGYSQLIGYITSSGSLDGTVGLSVQQSVNSGSEWDIISASQVSATAFTTSCMIDIIGDAIRVRSKNGATKTSNLRMLFQLKPVAGTALISGSVTITSGSITSGSLDELKSGSVVITSGSITTIASGSIDIAGALPTGTNSIGNIGTVSTVSSITAGSIDIVGALPIGTNSIGNIGTVSTVSSITAGSVSVTNIPDPIAITFGALTAASMGNANPASIIAVNASRRGLIFTNVSDTIGYLSIGNGAGLTASNYLFRVGTGETIEFSPPISQQAIAAICGAASKNATYQEAT